MNIPGSPPLTRIEGLRGHISVCYRRDGRVILKKWPKKRGEPKHPATVAQVAIWDMVLEMVKHANGKEFAIALSETDGTAFYAKDILISAAYGNYISWPGWGFIPNGPVNKPNPK